MFKFGEGGHEDGAGIREHGEKGSVGVAEGIDEEELSARGGKGARSKDVPNAVMDAHEWGTDTKVWGGEGGEVDRLKLVEVATRIQQTDGVASYEATERVAHNTDLLDRCAGFLKISDVVLHFLGHSLAAEVDPVVGEIADIGLGDENMQFVF